MTEEDKQFYRLLSQIHKSQQRNILNEAQMYLFKKRGVV